MRSRVSRAHCRRLAGLAVLLAVGAAGCQPSPDKSAPGPADGVRASSADPTSLAPRFETYTLADGLASNEANVMLQDRQGFLWVGTFSGLSRYDGAAFETFLHDPTDSTSLGHNFVSALAQDRSGTIGVGTRDVPDRYDPETETFSHLRHDPLDPEDPSAAEVRAIVVDAAGTVWVGTVNGGLDRFDTASDIRRRRRARVVLGHHERRRLGDSQHLNVGYVDLHVARLDFVALALTDADLAPSQDHVLAPHLVRESSQIGVDLGREHQLRDAVAVAQVDEVEPAEVAALVDPTLEYDGLPGVGLAERAAGVGPVAVGGGVGGRKVRRAESDMEADSRSGKAKWGKYGGWRMESVRFGAPSG